MSDRVNFTCRLTLPLAWACLASAPSADARAAAVASNAAIAGLLLHEIERGAAPRPADERLVEALAPLHAKLDMIIEMLGRLSYRDAVLPPRRDIELSHGRVGWLAPKALPVGSWLCLKLYFHPTFLEPLALFARVAFCGDGSGDAGCDVQAELDEMPEAVGEAYARLAFLAQRRQLADRPAPNTARHVQ
jgi:hypothetical protein